MIVTFSVGYAVYAEMHNEIERKGAKHCRRVKLRYNYLKLED